ncbi:hypothetical protein DLAC_01480 [Tieghemostelium lacteum]|uniref:Vacuolar protein sorting-associated protein 16 homolog n=1 Tax=Tieghemostelium lacteum TaxID=361077 RepID=A0A152A5I5_TIELA|nr:hypothetical protein DLAC_01480 [Tieghemostelium lacteum]|eukprot:KYR01493.1 hypothetical protein DLAC_01480 [Tieghemostelium lacteum]
MSVLASSNWSIIGNSTYSKKEIYSLPWDIDLKQSIVVGAPFGGPIVVYRDSSKLLEVNSQNSKNIIRIFTAAGYEMSKMMWDSTKGNIVTMDWIEKERLVIVLESGIVLIYNIFCELLSQFSMGDAVKKEGIIDCKIWSDGIVVLTGQVNFYTVPSVEDIIRECGRVIQLAKIQEEVKVKPGWCILEPKHSVSQGVEVFASINETLYLIDEDKADSQLDSISNITRMVVSPSGIKMACFDARGVLWIVNTDGSTTSPVKFETKSQKAPLLKWCGNDGVMMYWDSVKDPVLLYFSQGDTWAKYTTDSSVSLVTEIDGLRIISNRTSEFFGKVSDVTIDIFKIGSTSPAAMLYDATEHFINKSPRADESIRSIKSDLELAVNSCILAAGYEFSGSEQSKLLTAASFGKCFLDGYNPNAFVNMCRSLRALNAVRNFEIGIPLTIQQFTEIGPEEVIDKLINRRKHLLAWRMCDYLKIKSDVVLNHWACTKVRTDIDDNELSRIIINKLESVPGISFANIASAAYMANRKKLAAKLLEYEPKAADQVPPLIKMGESETALGKAIESGDTDLVYLVLLDMKRNRPLADFLEVTFSKSVAVDLLISYCKQNKDMNLLKEIYGIKQQTKEMSFTFLYEAFREPNFEKRLGSFEKSKEFFQQNKQDKDDQSNAQLVQEQIKLEILQKELENTTKESFLGMSISDTIYKLIITNDSKKAMNLKSEFKVPDKRFWWIKIKALSALDKWEELFQFSKEKKSPIGYEPFAEVCLEQNQPTEALKYIPKVQDPVNRVQLYIQINYYREAAEVAFKEKSIDLLNLIARKCTNPEVLNLVDQMRSQLQRR